MKGDASGGRRDRDCGILCRSWCLYRLGGRLGVVVGLVLGLCWDGSSGVVVVVDVVAVAVGPGRCWNCLGRVVEGVEDLDFGLGMCFGVEGRVAGVFVGIVVVAGRYWRIVCTVDLVGFVDLGGRFGLVADDLVLGVVGRS